METDLYRSQRTCCQLDQSKGFTEPVESWFWPALGEDQAEDDEHYEEYAENADNGQEAGEEERPIVDISNLEEEKDIRKQERYDEYEDEFIPEEKLQMITEYLRSQYRYCLWCGITFKDTDDMNAACPGSTRDDHDE